MSSNLSLVKCKRNLIAQPSHYGNDNNKGARQHTRIYAIMNMCEKSNVGTYKIVETLETIDQRQHSIKLDNCNNRMRQVLDKAGRLCQSLWWKARNNVILFATVV
jgi:hypothetical protein